MKVDTLEDFTKLLLQLHTYDFLTTLFKLWGHYLLYFITNTYSDESNCFLWVLFASINGYFSWQHQLYIYYLDLGKKILINSWLFCLLLTVQPPLKVFEFLLVAFLCCLLRFWNLRRNLPKYYPPLSAFYSCSIRVQWWHFLPNAVLL